MNMNFLSHELVGHPLLDTLNAARNSLLSIENDELAIFQALKILGGHSGADRAYIFKNYTDEETGKDYCSHLIEWHSHAVAPQSDDPDLKKFFYETQKMGWLLEKLQSGSTVQGSLEEFPYENHALLRKHNIKSLLIEPIFLQNNFWGFIGLDACNEYIRWGDDARFLLENLGPGLATYYDRFQLHREINLQKEFYKTILENAREGISLLDTNGKITYQSPSNPQVIGYSNEEVRQMDFFDLIHPEDREFAQSLYMEIFDNPGKLFKAVVRLKHAQGYYFKLSLEVINLLHIPYTSGIVVNFRDVSESEDYKEVLLQKQAMLKQAQALAKIGSYEINLGNGNVHVSDELFVIHGLDKDVIQDESPYYEYLTPLIHPDDKEHVLKMTEEGILTGTGYRIEYRIITPQGDIKYLVSKGDVELNDKNEPVKIVGTTQDISERKIQEEQLRTISANLTKKNQQLENFAYVTSHNLRTPINNLKGLCSLLDLESLSPENDLILQKFKPLIDQLDNSLTDIVENINAINTATDPEKVSFQQIYNAVLIEIENLFEECKPKISFDFTQAEGLKYPRSHIHNIFLNMLTNSLKYRKRDQQLEINISSYRDNGYTILEFKDNGIGIDLSKYKHRIFKMNDRLGADKNSDGKGLGLYIVKKQLKQNDGTISVQSEPGKGAIFTIRLKTPEKSF